MSLEEIVMGSSSAKMGVFLTAAILVSGCAQQVKPIGIPDAASRGGVDSVPEAHSKAMADSDSRAACEKAIEARAAYGQASLDVGRFAGYSSEIDEDGNRRIVQEFIVKTSSGSEMPYRAYCVVRPDGTVDMTMAAAAAR